MGFFNYHVLAIMAVCLAVICIAHPTVEKRAVINGSDITNAINALTAKVVALQAVADTLVTQQLSALTRIVAGLVSLTASLTSLLASLLGSSFNVSQGDAQLIVAAIEQFVNAIQRLIDGITTATVTLLLQASPIVAAALTGVLKQLSVISNALLASLGRVVAAESDGLAAACAAIQNALAGAIDLSSLGLPTIPSVAPIIPSGAIQSIIPSNIIQTLIPSINLATLIPQPTPGIPVFPSIPVISLPAVSLPAVSLPAISLPAVSLPAVPSIGLPKFP